MSDSNFPDTPRVFEISDNGLTGFVSLSDIDPKGALDKQIIQFDKTSDSWSSAFLSLSSIDPREGSDTQIIQYDNATDKWGPAFLTNTAVAQSFSDSGSVIFTGFSSLVKAKKITVMMHNVVPRSAAQITIQFGSGGSLKYGDYNSASLAGSDNVGNMRRQYDGFVIAGTEAGVPMSGLMNFATLGDNIWAGSGSFTASMMALAAGSIALDGPIDIIRIGTVNDSGIIQSGSVNITWEY